MIVLELVDVASDEVIDTVTVAADGTFTSETGAADSLITARANLIPDPAEMTASLTGWSNGYLQLRPVLDGTGAVDLGRAYSQEGSGSIRQPSGPPEGGQFAKGGGRVGAKPKQGGHRRPAGQQQKPAPKPAGPPKPFSYDGNTGTGYGVKGGDAGVRSLQATANRLGVTDSGGAELAVDGRYGPRTTSVVKKIQKRLGLEPDGKVTPELLKQITDLKQLPERTPRKRAAAAQGPASRPKPRPTAGRRDEPTRRSRILAQISQALGEHRLVDGVCVCRAQHVEDEPPLDDAEQALYDAITEPPV